jgi:hypothetical protein
MAFHADGQLKALSTRAPIFADAPQDTQYLAIPFERPFRFSASPPIGERSNQTRAHSGDEFHVCAVPGCKERCCCSDELVRY